MNTLSVPCPARECGPRCALCGGSLRVELLAAPPGDGCPPWHERCAPCNGKGAIGVYDDAQQQRVAYARCYACRGAGYLA